MWVPVTKGGDPSLEYLIYPGVLTFSLILFPTGEPKGQPRCSVFPWDAP